MILETILFLTIAVVLLLVHEGTEQPKRDKRRLNQWTLLK